MNLPRRVAWLVRRYAPVVLAAGTVYTLALVLRQHDYTPMDQIDTRMITAMGVAYALAALVMFLFNEEWTLRAHGQFWTYVGDAALWGGVGLDRLDWRRPMTTSELVVVRACFVVGSAALILGLAWLLLCKGRGWLLRRGWWPAWLRHRRILAGAK